LKGVFMGEIRQRLLNHPDVVRLARRRGVPRHQVVFELLSPHSRIKSPQTELILRIQRKAFRDGFKVGVRRGRRERWAK
jgi:hypothetical protein